MDQCLSMGYNDKVDRSRRLASLFTVIAFLAISALLSSSSLFGPPPPEVPLTFFPASPACREAMYKALVTEGFKVRKLHEDAVVIREDQKFEALSFLITRGLPNEASPPLPLRMGKCDMPPYCPTPLMEESLLKVVTGLADVESIQIKLHRAEKAYFRDESNPSTCLFLVKTRSGENLPAGQKKALASLVTHFDQDFEAANVTVMEIPMGLEVPSDFHRSRPR